jgi:hypothetical protein
MILKPVKKYRTPAYPTRQDALEDRSLLYDNQPASWSHIPQLAAIAALLITASSCAKLGTDKPSPKPEAVVAPIFKHGEGQAAFGGRPNVSFSPSHIPEEEAIQIISEELKKSSVAISRRNVGFPDIMISERELQSARPTEKQNDLREIPGTAQALNIDLIDDKKHLAVEYISGEDNQELGGYQTKYSTVQFVSLPDTAGYVARSIKEQGKAKNYYGIFYDPIVYPDKKIKNAAEESRRLLKEQVKDFLDWLEAEGVL